MHPIIQRLKERKLVQWALAYLAGAFVAMQAVETLTGTWELSPIVGQIVFVLLVCGLPVTLTLAWYHGEEGRQRVSGPELVIIAVLLGIAGVLSAATFRTNGLDRTDSPNAAERAGARAAVAFVETVPEADLRVNGYGSYLAVSPDGQAIVLAGQRGLLIRYLEEPGYRLIEGTEGAFDPTFSPDGATIAFRLPDGVYFVGSNGGPTSYVATAPYGLGLAWAGDWIYSGGSARIRVTDGTVEPLSAGGSWPQVLPGVDEVLLTRVGPSGEGRALVVHDLDGERQWVLREDVLTGRYAAGYILMVQPSGTVVAQRYDRRARALTGSAVPVLSNVRVNSWGAGAQLATGGGTLVYVDGGRVGNGQLLLADRSGSRTLIGEPANYAGQPQISPTGSDYVITRRGGNDDVWLYGLQSSKVVPISSDPSEDERPVFSPTGDEIAWSGTRSGSRMILTRRTDVSAPETAAFQVDKHVHLSQWTPHRNALIWAEDDTIWSLEFDGDGVPRPLLTGAGINRPSVSPDGRLLVYSAEAEGRQQIHLAGYSMARGTEQATTAGGHSPRWSADGTELFYMARDTLWALSVGPAGSVDARDPRPVLAEPRVNAYAVWGTQGFLLLQDNPDALMREVKVIVDWPAMVSDG